jgi:LuxR family transcriptional regulator, maltose regulon positive regulatory protein
MTVLRGMRSPARIAALARWVSDLSPDAVAVAWLRAGPHPADPSQFWVEVEAGLRSSGLLPPVRPGLEAARGSQLLNNVLLGVGEGRRLLLVIDDFDDVVDDAVLVELVELVQRHRHFHVCVCVRGRHPVESVAAATVELRTVSPREWVADIEPLADPTRLLDGVDGAALGFLWQLSLPEVLERSLALALCEAPEPERLLAELEQAGLLERHYRGEQVLLRFPGDLRDVLRDQYDRRDPTGARRSHARLVQWYLAREGGSGAEPALRHATAAESWPLVEQVWDLHAVTLHLCHPRALVEALDVVPASLTASRPAMLLARQVLRAGKVGDGGGYWLGAAARFGGLEHRGDPPPLDFELPDLLYAGALQVMGLRQTGQLQASLDAALSVQRAVSALGMPQTFGRDRLAWFHLQWGITLTLAGDPGAEPAYRRAWEYGLGANATFIPGKAAANLALTYAIRGESAVAQMWLDRHGQHLHDDPMVRAFVGIGARIAEGFLALDRGAGADAGAALAELDYGAVSVELASFVTFLRAEHALHHGDPEAALAGLVTARNVQLGAGPDRGLAAALAVRAEADLLIATGRTAEVRLLLRAQGEAVPLLTVPLARFYLLNGDYAGARRVAVRSEWDPAILPADRVELLLIHASAARRQGDHDTAGRLMGHALDAAADTPRRALASMGYPETARLLALAGRSLAPGDREILESSRPPYPEALVVVELSARERSVLTQLARTASRHEIAASLFVSINTVKSQLASAYYKLGATTREQALAQARRLGLLEESGV